jgi:hypothetical protein
MPTVQPPEVPDWQSYTAWQEQNYKKIIDGIVVFFAGLIMLGIVLFAGYILVRSDPPSSDDIQKLAWGIIGTALGTCAGLLRRPA